ncbi:MAG TPA: hypothetical protein VFJ72_02580 [Rubrobacteraceae bacterium]|nr:hypothetical protein [Rubrobacteraceae bacterium]
MKHRPRHDEPRAAFRASRVSEHLFALALYTALAVVFTYPLAFNMDRVDGAGDPAVMVWSMAWIQHALTTGASLYDANIFYPTQNALAYTDLLLPSAVITTPLYLATDNPLLSFNVVLLLTYVLSGYATFLLVRRLLGGRPYALLAALFAGAVYALCPYRYGHITQLNTMTTYWLPLILLFMHRYLEDGRRFRDMLLVGLFFTLNVLSGLYYGVFAVLMMASFYLLWSFMHREPPKVRDLALGIPVFAAFGAVLALVLGPYIALSGASDHARDISTVAGGSFVPAAILTSVPESWFLGWTPEVLGITHENRKPVYELTLYPGLAVTALAVYGLLRRNRVAIHSALYALLGLVIFIFSCGPAIPVGDSFIPLPYYLLYEFVPGFGNLRVPARMWAIVMLCIAVLAGFGLRALMQRLGGKKALLALAVISLFTAFEFVPKLPIDRYIDRGPATIEPAYRYLADRAPGAVVAEVPFASPADAFRETPRMYRSTFGWWRLVNGYASYFPDGYTETRDALNTLPSPESLKELRRLGVEYVVVHPDQYDVDGMDGEEMSRKVGREPSLQRVAGDGETVLFRVKP